MSGPGSGMLTSAGSLQWLNEAHCFEGKGADMLLPDADTLLPDACVSAAVVPRAPPIVSTATVHVDRFYGSGGHGIRTSALGSFGSFTTPEPQHPGQQQVVGPDIDVSKELRLLPRGRMSSYEPSRGSCCWEDLLDQDSPEAGDITG